MKKSESKEYVNRKMSMLGGTMLVNIVNMIYMIIMNMKCHVKKDLWFFL